MAEENKYKITLVSGYKIRNNMEHPTWIDDVSENDMLKIITNIGKDYLFQYKIGDCSCVVNLRFFSTCYVKEKVLEKKEQENGRI